MNTQEALVLVRDKYLEEQRGVVTGEIAKRYNQATQQYPATMMIAHQLFALEMAKTMSSTR